MNSGAVRSVSTAVRWFLVAAVAFLCAPSWADEGEAVLTDGKGHYIVYAPAEMVGLLDHRLGVYVGDKGGLFRYEATREDRDDNKEYREFQVISNAGGGGTVDLRSRPITLSCRNRKPVSLLPVSGADREKILRVKRYEHNRYPWSFWALGRDLDALYYYVEKSTTQSSNFRFYVGERAKMKRQKVIRVADDHEGELLVTPAGTLELSKTVAGYDPGPSYQPAAPVAYWRPKKGPAKPLTILAFNKGNTSSLVYDELGIHLGVVFGDPCSLFHR